MPRPASARRDEGEYRQYATEEQRSQAGCSACRMQLDFHHGLLEMGLLPTEVIVRLGAFAGVLGLMVVWETLAPRRGLRVGRRRWSANLTLSVLNTLVVRFAVPLGTYGAAELAVDRG